MSYDPNEYATQQYCLYCFGGKNHSVVLTKVNTTKKKVKIDTWKVKIDKYHDNTTKVKIDTWCSARRNSEMTDFPLHRIAFDFMVWKRSLQAFQDLPPSTGNGWELEDGCLKPVLMSQDAGLKG